MNEETNPVQQDKRQERVDDMQHTKIQQQIERGRTFEPRISEEVLPALAVVAPLTEDGLEQTERRETEENENLESPSCQQSVP
jgi:hypothetical protein